jgi:hypothetical protein
VRDVIRNFNADGFDSLYPKYQGGRPPKFTLGQRREIILAKLGCSNRSQAAVLIGGGRPLGVPTYSPGGRE